MTLSKSDRIAICCEAFPTSLKHRLLFFDRVGVFQPDMILRQLHNLRSDGAISVANDLEFLQNKSIVFDAMSTYSRQIAKHLEAAFSNFLAKEEMADGITELMLSTRAYYCFVENELPEDMIKTATGFERLRQLQGRLVALRMQHGEGLTVSALLSGPLIVLKELHDSFEKSSADVIDVVLDKLPMPSEQTSWEAILDFKADTEAQGYLQGLKVWMGDIARQKLTPTEASEKLEWLIFQHKKHLEMHKLSCRWGTLGGTFVAAAEILEDLVKIKWSKAAKAIVSIVDKRVELMKAELSNPAKEVGYIVKAQERFEG